MGLKNIEAHFIVLGSGPKPRENIKTERFQEADGRFIRRLHRGRERKESLAGVRRR